MYVCMKTCRNVLNMLPTVPRCGYENPYLYKKLSRGQIKLGGRTGERQRPSKGGSNGIITASGNKRLPMLTFLALEGASQEIYEVGAD